MVRELLAHVQESGAGYRYLIQHSAGSGKSYSIAWLAHQLVGLERDDAVVFNSIIVVTDRIILDQQINETIKQYMQVRATVGHADSARDLRKFIEGGKKIVITTVQKFPFILEEIGQAHRGGNFAIIIDEAHSSQGGRTAAAVNIALTDAGDDPDDIETTEDQINRIIEEMTKKKQMPQNASYFAFTATPKNKTLELFGEPYHEDGQVKHRPFHTYTMKQAIEERFILDVLQSYTPVQSYYRLVKTTEADPEFETSRAIRKLHRYVEAHDHAIRLKAEIIVDHFHEQVLAARKINGQARAMVVTERVNRAIAYYYAIQSYLEERNSRYRALVAFSGEREYQGSKVSEASLNGFPSAKTAERFQDDPYRFLIVADKFQTGYDEPLLHTMYVDKTLAGIRAVQTLSRLNRAHPYKHDVFVLDFMNDADMIQRAFEPYYRSTILSSETDPNKLHDLQAELEGYQVYTDEDIDQLVELYLSGAERDQLDPILDHCVAAYVEYLDEDGQVGFKGRAKAFTRTYNFLVSILPYSNIWWEKLSIFLNFLIPKLPAPVEEDPTRGLIEVIDMESYRVEKQATIKIALADEDTEIEPVPTGGVGLRPEVKVDILSNIIAMFNDQFGNIEWTDEDRVRRLITEELPEAVLADEKYANAVKHSGRQNARVELSAALQRVIFNILKDDSELLKQFLDNPSFNKWLEDAIFALTYVESP